MSAKPRVSLVGLGQMGVPMAERLLAAGYPLTVFNRTVEKTAPLVEQGALLAHALSELLADADICISVVSDDVALEAVAAGPDGVLSNAAPGSVFVDMSTVSVAASARVAEAADRAGVLYLRAPVSGNPGVVRAGNLTVIVSGPQAGLDAAHDVLAAIGPNVLSVGDAEQARVVKLALQVMIGGTAELLAEAVVLGESAGVERGKLLEVIGASAVGSPFVKYKTEPLLRDDYSATFTTSMMMKDVGLVLGLASESGVTLPLSSRLEGLLDETIEAGHGELDFMALLLRLEAERKRASTDS
jgi:3-hydroxyisobutyrate dehydrogenase-like beta-hydroxyacid dehydrogenase